MTSPPILRPRYGGAVGAIGELSMFHQTHGYYVQGVGRDTAVLPEGSESRLVAVSGPNTNGRTGLCLDAHDLCLARLVAHREKDLTFVGALIEAGLIDPVILAAGWNACPLPTHVARQPFGSTSNPQSRTDRQIRKPPHQ